MKRLKSSSSKLEILSHFTISVSSFQCVLPELFNFGINFAGKSLVYYLHLRPTYGRTVENIWGNNWTTTEMYDRQFHALLKIQIQ